MELIHLTHNSVSEITPRQLEHVLLMPVITVVQSFNFQVELLDEGTRVPRLRVGVRVPGLLLDHQSRLRQYAL